MASLIIFFVPILIMGLIALAIIGFIKSATNGKHTPYDPTRHDGSTWRTTDELARMKAQTRYPGDGRGDRGY
ncbi:hypothetical protein OG588_27790 [Streptomyces prunicolor]|uniref:hypothetical protein n=1 Tax=Streptomyces prunicolor TaxID=67348 RepID=UPI003868EB56|nr:hypothetical protein OG588_27790 [Streptomyces prunicolor]